MNGRNEAFAEVEALTRNVQLLDDRLERLTKMASGGSSAASQINVDAGGVGVWAAVSACGVMLALNLGMALIVMSHDRKVGEMQHQLNAIYMMAPSLKEEVQKEIQARKNSL